MKLKNWRNQYRKYLIDHLVKREFCPHGCFAHCKKGVDISEKFIEMLLEAVVHHAKAGGYLKLHGSSKLFNPEFTKEELFDMLEL